MTNVIPMPTPEHGPSPCVPRHDRLTQAGAAERFAAEHAARLRFDHRRGEWLLWEAHHWRRDADGSVINLALDTVRRWQHDALDLADARLKSDALKWAASFDRRSNLDALLGLARCLPPLASDGANWDADPWLLGCPNGVVDLRTGTLRDGQPEDAITKQTGAPFDADAACPRWAQAISEWFPDGDLAAFVWLALGYSITGITTEQSLFTLYNRGAGGKTTLLRTVAHTLGDYAFDMPFSVVELHQRASIPNDLAALDGRRFILASETNDGTRLNEARVKSLTGGDACTARFLHGEFFTFQPVGKFWLAFNHKPIVRDDSFAFWRRVRLLPFVRTFQPDPTLSATLKAEAPGILAWLVRGCLAWQERGLSAPAIVTDATNDYQADSDDFGRFLDEATEADEFAEVTATDLYAHYQQWADSQGFAPRERLTVTAFGRKAGERLRRVSTRGPKVYIGRARR